MYYFRINFSSWVISYRSLWFYFFLFLSFVDLFSCSIFELFSVLHLHIWWGDTKFCCLISLVYFSFYLSLPMMLTTIGPNVTSRLCVFFDTLFLFLFLMCLWCHLFCYFASFFTCLWRHLFVFFSSLFYVSLEFFCSNPKLWTVFAYYYSFLCYIFSVFALLLYSVFFMWLSVFLYFLVFICLL